MSSQATPRIIVTLGGVETDITQWVKDFKVGRGQQKFTDQPEPGDGTFLLVDTDRRFDPINALSPYAGNLASDLPIRLEIDYGTGSGYQARWWGYTNLWEPQYYGDEGAASGFTLLTAVGLCGFTNEPMPRIFNDWIREIQSRSPNRVFYTFNSDNGTGAGRVQDFSGQDADGVS